MIRDEIKAAQTAAMKGGDKERLAAVRLILAKIKDRDIELRTASQVPEDDARAATRSEENTSELQSLMRTSYAVFCLKKKKRKDTQNHITHTHSTSILTIERTQYIHHTPLMNLHSQRVV